MTLKYCQGPDCHTYSTKDRLKEVKHLTEENAWTKGENYYTWQRENNEPRYYFYNGITKEQRPLTEQQYNDTNYTLNER